jgi:hypothetical protein
MEQRIISEDKLNSYHLDLRSAQKGQINESFLAMFGETLKTILKRMFGRMPSAEELGPYLKENEEEDQSGFGDVKVTGTKAQMKALALALAAEKKYMEAYVHWGLKDERTKESRYELYDAIETFEKTTGLLWPFK